MFSNNRKISGRQAFRLLTFDLLGLSTLLVPTVLGNLAGRDGILCIGLGILAALLYLRLLRIIMRDMETAYPKYLELRLGQLPGKILQVGYLIYFVLLAGYTAYLFSSLVLKNLLREESFYLVLVLILLVAAYGIWGGIEGRARVYEILFWMLIIPLFIMLFSGLTEVRVDYWTPVFSSGIGEVAAGSYYMFQCMSLVFLVLFANSYLKKKEQAFAAGRGALLFAGVVHAVLYLILLGVFGAGALGQMEFPAVTLMSTVKMTGGFLKRTDAFMFSIWFFTLYALLNSAVFYGGTVLFYLTGADRPGGRLKKEGKERLFAGVVLIMALAVAVIFYKSQAVCEDYEGFLWYLGTPFLVLVPLMLILCIYLQKRKGRGAPQGREEDVRDAAKNTSEKDGGAKSMSGKKRKRVLRVAAVLLSLSFGGIISGCAAAELEDRDFPIEMAVDDTESFAAEWLSAEKSGNRMVDYNHLKVIVIGQDFLENAESMEEFLTVLEEKTEVPRSTYIVVAEDAEAILKLSDQMGESVGNYLEEQFENVSEVEKKAYPTLGMLYQEEENQMETLFIPYIRAQGDKPVVDHYYAWKRGTPAGAVDSEAALLAFFTDNEMESCTLSLEDGAQVRLAASQNEISFEENSKQREIVVDVYCTGEVLYEKKGETQENLEKQIEAYMNEVSEGALEEKGIDLSNSYRKLGGYMRQWYPGYVESGESYEEDMDIVYQVHITWVTA